MRERKAVGSKCTKAVAISTPVPKCCEMKMKRPAFDFFEDRRDTNGKPQAMLPSDGEGEVVWTGFSYRQCSRSR